MSASSSRVARMPRRLRARVVSATGQSVIEMAMILPLLTVIVLGVVELSYGLLDQHIVTRLTREGSNLISRDTTLDDAYQALVGMSTPPVNFNTRSKVIFTVVMRVATTGAANYNQNVVYQQKVYGNAGVPGASALTFSAGSGAFGGSPDYIATDPSNNTALRVSGVPANSMTLGDLIYVTEIYTKHDLLTPLNQFGTIVPTTLYSIAYF